MNSLKQPHTFFDGCFVKMALLSFLTTLIAQLYYVIPTMEPCVQFFFNKYTNPSKLLAFISLQTRTCHHSSNISSKRQIIYPPASLGVQLIIMKHTLHTSWCFSQQYHMFFLSQHSQSLNVIVYKSNLLNYFFKSVALSLQ